MTIYRVTAEGNMPQGDIFNWTWHVTGAAGSVDAVTSAAGDALLTMWKGPQPLGGAPSIEAFMSTDTELSGLRVDELDANGHNVSQRVFGLTAPGTNVNQPLPPNVAIAVSLRTSVPRQRGRGRFYLPATAIDTATGGKLISGTRATIAAAAQGALRIMNAATFPVVIYHRDNHTFDVVISLDVGDVFDNIERRRRQLLETRSSLPVP